jgi:hypothetical protein
VLVGLIKLKTKSMAKLQAEQVVKVLINKMFEIAGYDVKYEDVLERKDDWYNQYTWTEEKNKEWIEWGTQFMAKNFVRNKKWAQREMVMFNLNYGLKTIL